MIPQFRQVSLDFFRSMTLPRVKPAYESGVCSSVEIKIRLTCPNDLQMVLEVLAKQELMSASMREEEHQVYITQSLDSKTLVWVRGVDRPWVKIKRNLRRHQTKLRNFPAISRVCEKYKPDDSEYMTALQSEPSARNLIRYSKHCANYYFAKDGHVLSLSVSLAHNEDGFSDCQAEIEYEGAAGRPAANISEQLTILESVIVGFYLPHANNLVFETKVEKAISVIQGVQNGYSPV